MGPMVRVKRFELLRLTAPDPKSGVYANFTTLAYYWYRVWDSNPHALTGTAF